jgi:hypothetical protein
MCNDRKMSTEQQTALELLVDSCGLDLVLAGLANICAGKSDHILANWEDRNASRAWLSAMVVCDHAATRNQVHKVSE